MKHRGLKFLSLLLTLALLVGLMPGMSLTAYAATTHIGSVPLQSISAGDTISSGTTIIGIAYYVTIDGTPVRMPNGTAKYGVDNGYWTTPSEYLVDAVDKVTNPNIPDIKLKTPTIAVTDVSIEPSSFQTLTLGKPVTVKAEVYPDNATNKKVEWSVTVTGVTLYADQACTTPVTLGDPTSLLTVYAKATAVGGGAVYVSSADNHFKFSNFSFEVKPTVTYVHGAGTGEDQPFNAISNGQGGYKHDIEKCEDYFSAPEGKHFDHWDDGKGHTYKYGATINPVTENITLTAIWVDEPKPDSGSGGGSGGGFDLVFNLPGADDSWEYVGGGYVPQRAYRVSLAPMQGGSAALGLTTGDSGTALNVYPTSAVYVFPNADPGYTLDKIVWSLIDGSASYDITETKNFVMPAMDAVVYVTFRPVG